MNKVLQHLAFAMLMILAIAPAHADVFVRLAPPPLPYYEQPLVPADGYLWTPGYWAFDDEDGEYFWVPGAWVLAPAVGYLWTPGYWAWDDYGYGYAWRPGYWGPRVGYYGGINYGYGYYGDGYVGGRWYGSRFSYNRAVNNVSIVSIHNTYNTTVIQRNDNRISYSGGGGGVHGRPRPEDELAGRDRHLTWTETQQEQQNRARRDRGQFATANPAWTGQGASSRPSGFDQPGRGDPRRSFPVLPGLHDRRDDSARAPVAEPPLPRNNLSQPAREVRQNQPLWNREGRMPGDRFERRDPVLAQPMPTPMPSMNRRDPPAQRPAMPTDRGAAARFNGGPLETRGAMPGNRAALPGPHDGNPMRNPRRERDPR